MEERQWKIKNYQIKKEASERLERKKITILKNNGTKHKQLEMK